MLEKGVSFLAYILEEIFTRSGNRVHGGIFSFVYVFQSDP